MREPAPETPSAYNHAEALELDREMLQDKLADGYARRNDAAALRLQMDYQLKTGDYL